MNKLVIYSVFGIFSLQAMEQTSSPLKKIPYLENMQALSGKLALVQDLNENNNKIVLKTIDQGEKLWASDWGNSDVDAKFASDGRFFGINQNNTIYTYALKDGFPWIPYTLSNANNADFFYDYDGKDGKLLATQNGSSQLTELNLTTGEKKFLPITIGLLNAYFRYSRSCITSKFENGNKTYQVYNLQTNNSKNIDLNSSTLFAHTSYYATHSDSAKDLLGITTPLASQKMTRIWNTRMDPVPVVASFEQAFDIDPRGITFMNDGNIVVTGFTNYENGQHVKACGVTLFDINQQMPLKVIDLEKKITIDTLWSVGSSIIICDKNNEVYELDSRTPVIAYSMSKGTSGNKKLANILPSKSKL